MIVSMFNFGELDLQVLDASIQKVKGIVFLLDKLPSKDINRQVNYGWDREEWPFRVTYAKNRDKNYVLTGVKTLHNHSDIYLWDIDNKLPLRNHDENMEIEKENINKSVIHDLEAKISIKEEMINSGMNSIYLKNSTSDTQTKHKRQKTFNFK